MNRKDATRNFGSVGTILSVLVIFLISAGAAFACPEHHRQVVYRTYYGSEPVRTTMVSYGSPCSDTVGYSPRIAKRVAVRRGGYYESVPGYIAMQHVNYDRPMRTRYVAMHDYDYDYAPRYVAVRSQPAYVGMGSKYALMRNNYVPRTRYVVVRDSGMEDYDYAPTQYVAVRHAPIYDAGMRFVAVSRNDQDLRPIGYIPLRGANMCACNTGGVEADETVHPTHTVIKSDYIDGRQEVVYQDPTYDDMAYIAEPDRTRSAYNVGYFHNNGESIVRDNYVDTTGRVSYVPADLDRDFDDQAIVDTNDVTYVAANDIDDACLSPSTNTVRPRSVSYVPVQDAEEMVSYVPANHIKHMNAAPVQEISYVPAEDVSYVPAEDTNLGTVAYVPAGSVVYVDTAGTVACECPVSENSVLRAEPDQVAYPSTAVVQDTDSDSTAYSSDTEAIADNDDCPD